MMYNGPGPVQPMNTMLVMHNGQLIHVPVMSNGLGVTYAQIQQQDKSRTLQAINTNNTPERASPKSNLSTPPNEFTPSKAPSKPSSPPNPTTTPQRTPKDKLASQAA